MSVSCTFTITNTNYTKQFWYQCNDCYPSGRDGVCAVCAVTCHKDHNVNPIPRYTNFYCDCGEGGTCTRIEPSTTEEGAITHYGCGEFILSNNVSPGELEHVLEEYNTPWYTVSGSSYYIPWMGKNESQPVFSVVQALCKSYAGSCEIQPEGIAYVYDNGKWVCRGNYNTIDKIK